jgi:hypothetical protein
VKGLTNGFSEWDFGSGSNMRCVVAAAVLLGAAALGAQGTSKWVYPGAKGRLQYSADARGTRIMDFSHAGYQGGGVRIP